MSALQTEAINEGKLRGYVLAVFLGGFEARLLDGFKRLLVETCAAARGDLRLGNAALWINSILKVTSLSRPARSAIGGKPRVRFGSVWLHGRF